MSKPKGFMLIFIPSATVFISSFCIMVLELVASRLIARHLGSSLYTWTAVIGVILSGITIGNYIGGRIADKFPAKKSIAILFTICSAACITTIILNNLAGKWIWLWHFNWPMRVFSHVALVFLLPSTLLGTISPVVAKMALDRGLPTGRTVGDIYAWGAAGSIAGTFAAGYWLIAAMGTVTIIWVVGAVLLFMGILYWTRFWPLHIWAVIFAATMAMAMIPAKWAQDAGASVGLRKANDPKILYEDESKYCHITVERDSSNPNKRFFCQDKLKQCKILMNDVLDLQYFYMQIYGAVTEGLGKDKEKLSILAIGGGGYVFPRYVENIWPGSRIDVVEIDAGVTKAAIEAFGLEEDTTINTINMDGRNYVDDLLKQKRDGMKIPQYDFIYGDAFNDFSVPFQLVTKEFNDKIYAILKDDGVYMINVVDIFNSGLFVGAVINTLEQTFRYVYIATEIESYTTRNTFIIVAAKCELDLPYIISQYRGGSLKPWYPSDSDINKLKSKPAHSVLTDNYNPVENLLAPVVRNSAKTISAENIIKQAEELNQQGLFAKSIEKYLSAIKLCPAFSAKSYNEIGVMYARTGNLSEAVQAFKNALEYNGTSDEQIKGSIHYSLGAVLKTLGRTEEARGQFNNAAKEFRRELDENPNDSEKWNVLGDILVTTGDFQGATEAFKKAENLNPAAKYYYAELVIRLQNNGRYNEAIEILQKQLKLAQYNKQDTDVLRIRKYIKSLEYKALQNR
ncbi:MAG: fused MFS/spermidine synthase [Sedimentisphaerales bacterium]|nr:fused MFS/spermidine synthase [Sedimentisphaerales bacterium]